MTMTRSSTRSKNDADDAPDKAPSKLALMLADLARPAGASIADLAATTGWQAHSVRGAIAGALRKKGHHVTSSVIDGVRRYRLTGAK